MHVVDPATAETLPARHEIQVAFEVAALILEKDPARQVIQVVAPIMDENVPALHVSHVGDATPD